MSFYGEFTRNLNKGRVMLPVVFREEIEKFVYLYLAQDMSLEMYFSVENFKQEEFRYIYKVMIDSQGRVIIPKEVRGKMHISCSHKVLLIGYGDYIKILPVL